MLIVSGWTTTHLRQQACTTLLSIAHAAAHTANAPAAERAMGILRSASCLGSEQRAHCASLVVQYWTEAGRPSSELLGGGLSWRGQNPQAIPGLRSKTGADVGVQWAVITGHLP